MNKNSHTSKLRPYLQLNFRLVKRYYSQVFIFSLIGSVFPWASYIAVGFFILAGRELYSRSLYEKDAYLYQSVPVTEREIVASKTLVGAVGIFMILVGLAIGGTFSKGLLEAVNYVMSSMAVSGCILCSMSLANRMRGSRDRKPKAWVVLFFLGGCGAGLYGIDKAITYFAFLSTLQVNLIILGIAVIAMVSFYYLNTRLLKKHFSL